MAGQLDSLFRSVASTVVKDLGAALDATITYTRKKSPTYNVSTGSLTTSDEAYVGLKVPIEFIDSQERESSEQRRAKLYLTPDMIGNAQPNFEDTVALEYGEVSAFSGTSREGQIVDIRTYRGGQEYLYILEVVF
jgi:hypothetical protein|tara:strand:+ start:347 stop:751 length:405 start_codon:yes stop_codon:yes gene_type:complete